MMTTKNEIVPDWVKNAVFYEIYPQTFLDTNGNGIGDIEGMRQKLNYVKSVGATAIWLNPFYLSPMNDAGYDVSDYYMVDPRYGRNSDIKAFFNEADELGIKVIIDFVPGHTSIDHPWFKESAKKIPSEPFKNWYIWTESTWDSAGKWANKTVHGQSERDGNFLINFFSNQPALNFGFAEPDEPWQLSTDHPDVQELWKEMRNVMRFWLEMGASGFRVDMADSIVRNDPDKREIKRFWREAREELSKDYPEFFLIAEGHPSSTLFDGGFHSAYLHWVPSYWSMFRQPEERSQEADLLNVSPYFSSKGDGSTKLYMDTFVKEYNAVKDHGVITVPVGNHDLPRVSTGQSEDELELIFAFQASFPGIPFIYYGDEIGMRQIEGHRYPEGCYGSRSGARTPMQWDSTTNYGFSTAHRSNLYLDMDESEDAPTVENNESRKDSLLNRVRVLNEIHRNEPVFAADAKFELILNGEAGVPFIYKRSVDEREVICIFYPSEESLSFELSKTDLDMNGFETLKSVRMDIDGQTIKAAGISYGFFVKS